MTYAEGSEHKNEHAPSEVGQAALKGEAYGEAGSPEYGDEGGGLYAKHAGDGDEEQRLQGKPREAD